LFRVTVPSFLLQPVSLLEKASSYARPNSLLDGINDIKDPIQRILKITG